MPLPDYYAILEVPSDATLEEIKRSYRRLVRMYHPDLNKKAKDIHIKRLNEAYDVLGDSAKRLAYDIQRLEEKRRLIIQDLLWSRHIEAQRKQKMTWTQGLAGFMRELKKGMSED